MPVDANRIARLRAQAQRAQQMNATATSAIEFARQQLTQIDEEFRKEGVNPENAVEEVAALDTQLEATTSELEAQLQAEEAELARILDLARQAQLIR